jgi:hypothetical protein
VIVQVFVTQGQTIDPLRHQLRDPVLDPRRVAMVAKADGKLRQDAGALLHREGWKVGRYLTYRLYKEEGLTLRQQLRARVRGSRPAIRLTPHLTVRARGLNFRASWLHSVGIKAGVSPRQKLFPQNYLCLK